MDTSLKWTLFLVPRVSAYGRFDCIQLNNYWNFQGGRAYDYFLELCNYLLLQAEEIAIESGAENLFFCESENGMKNIKV